MEVSLRLAGRFGYLRSWTNIYEPWRPPTLLRGTSRASMWPSSMPHWRPSRRSLAPRDASGGCLSVAQTSTSIRSCTLGRLYTGRVQGTLRRRRPRRHRRISLSHPRSPPRPRQLAGLRLNRPSAPLGVRAALVASRSRSRDSFSRVLVGPLRLHSRRDGLPRRFSPARRYHPVPLPRSGSSFVEGAPFRAAASVQNGHPSDGMLVSASRRIWCAATLKVGVGATVAPEQGSMLPDYAVSRQGPFFDDATQCYAGWACRIINAAD